MKAATRALVRERAGQRSEYCQTHQEDSPLAALHIRPLKHGGDDDSNLRLACIDCNRYKGSNLAGINLQTQAVTLLFHPRQQHWNDHLRWDDLRIDGERISAAPRSACSG